MSFLTFIAGMLCGVVVTLTAAELLLRGLLGRLTPEKGRAILRWVETYRRDYGC